MVRFYDWASPAHKVRRTRMTRRQRNASRLVIDNLWKE